MPKAKDRATAFKNELAGSQTNKIVCKASSHDVAGPKKKHVDYLLQLVNHPKCQFSTLVDLISERYKDGSWIVVFKALIVTHNMMSLGNERFLQSVATRNHIFELDGFSDKTDSLGPEMSSYLRKYARYVRHLCIAYKTLAVDICRIPKAENSPFIGMDIPKILKAVAVIQAQLDLLLELEYAQSELTNGVINTSFLMLYKDLIKLYTVYNDALINLLEKFFDMKKSECKDTIGIYSRFLMRQESIQRFLQLAEDVGVDKDTHLNLRQVPEDLLPALENHLTEMDAAKKASGAQPSPQIRAASERLQQLRENDLRKNATATNQSGSGIISGYPSASNEILDAQRKRFEELKKRASEAKMNPSEAKTNPSAEVTSNTAATTTTTPSSSDLLSLNSKAATFDPWASTITSNSSSIPQAQQVPSNTSSNPFQTPSGTVSTNNPWGSPVTNGIATSTDPWGAQKENVISSYQEVDLFSEIRGPDFNSVFGATPSSGQQTSSPGNSLDILTPQAVGSHATQDRTDPVLTKLTSDVDSSLVLAAANLSVDVGHTRVGMTKKMDHQWNAPKESVKTGGPNWQRPNLQPSTVSKPTDWSSGAMQAGHFPVMGAQQQQQQQQPMMMAAQQPMMIGQQPMMMGAQQPMMMGQQPMMMQQRPMMMGQQPMMMGQQPMMQQPSPFMQQPAGMWGAQPQQQQNPFGQNAPLL